LERLGFQSETNDATESLWKFVALSRQSVDEHLEHYEGDDFRTADAVQFFDELSSQKPDPEELVLDNSPA
jgi:hypothetical protein